MAITHSFQTLFAVPMTCDGCIKGVSDALYRIQGISRVEASLEDQLVTVEGTVAPSTIIEAIQSTGKDAILRGSGGSNSAAVSILETYSPNPSSGIQTSPGVDVGVEPGSWVSQRHVRGLARMVQISSSPPATVVDLAVRNMRQGAYRVTIRALGDLSRGAASTGHVWRGEASSSSDALKGDLGTVLVDKEGHGNMFITAQVHVWEIIGHALAMSRRQQEGLSAEEDGKVQETLQNDQDTVVGVVARSAGVWDNDKTVCSCTGKTLWEEREEVTSKGML